MSMSWYFTSYSKDKFDEFRSDVSRAKELLSKFFNHCAESYGRIEDIESLVDYLVENGLTFDGYSRDKLDMAFDCLFGDDSSIEGFHPVELFGIEPETIEPIHTEFFPSDLNHPLLMKMNHGGEVAYLLCPEQLSSIREAIIPVLRRLETDGPDPHENVIPLFPKTLGVWTILKSCFFKNVVPKEKVEKLRRQLHETRIEVLKIGLLTPIDSILSKNKHAYLRWG